MLEELKATSSRNYRLGHVHLKNEAHLQLAFCYSAGFGTEIDRQLAVQQLFEAADNGLEKAMALTLRLPHAVGSPIPESLKIIQWLQTATLSGSRIAARDLFDRFPSQYTDVRSRQQQDYWKYLGDQLSRLLLPLSSTIPSFSESPGSMVPSIDGEFRNAIAGRPSRLIDWLIENHFDMYHDFLSGRDEQGDIPLFAAIKNADLALANYLLDFDAGLMKLGPSGGNALHWLCTLPGQGIQDFALLIMKKCPELINQESSSECLLSSSKVDHFLCKMSRGSTPLEWAIQHDLPELASSILSNGGRLRHQLDTRSLLLAFAARSRSTNTLTSLLRTEAACGINSFDENGWSPFYYALLPDVVNKILRFVPGNGVSGQESARERELTTVNILLEAGSDARIEENDALGCLHISTMLDDTERTALLLDRSDTYKYIDWTPHIRGVSTPLGWAISKGRVKCARLLLERGAYPKIVDPDRSYHALHACSSVDSTAIVEIAQALVTKDPSCVAAQAKHSETPLHVAAKMGNTRMIKFLLQNGAEVQAGKPTPLGTAITARSIAGVELILRELEKRNLAYIGCNRLSGLDFLLSPGSNSPSLTSQLGLGELQGCLDLPFSRTSEIILDRLLHRAKRRKFRESFRHTRKHN